MEGIVKKEPQELKEFQPLFNLICLSKYPFFVRASGKDKRKNLTYETTENGKSISWSITSSATSYLPGEPEFKIWIWLCDKVMKTKKETGEVPKYLDYSLYEIAKYWNMPTGGGNLKILQEGLENLKKTNINYLIKEGEVKKEKKEENKEILFSLLDAVLEKGSETEEGGVLTRGLIELSNTAKTMFEHGLLKPNGLETLKSLTDENIIASNLYQLLSYYYFITRKDIIDFWYNDLAEKLGLIPQKAHSSIERQFEKAKEVLKEKGVIKDLEIKKVIDQQDPQKEHIRCRFTTGETIKNEVKGFTRKADHQRLVAKIIENKTDQPDIDQEVSYWLEEIKTQLQIDPQDLKYLVHNIVKTSKNNSDLLCRAISETRQSQPENKKAYLITLLQKFGGGKLSSF